MTFIRYQMSCFDQTLYFPRTQARLVYGHYARRMAKKPELDYDVAQVRETTIRCSRHVQILVGWVIASDVTSVGIAMCAS